jgi:hypothetical protein
VVELLRHKQFGTAVKRSVSGVRGLRGPKVYLDATGCGAHGGQFSVPAVINDTRSGGNVVPDPFPGPTTTTLKAVMGDSRRVGIRYS